MYQPFLIAYFIKIDKFYWYSANRKIQFQVKKLHLMHLKNFTYHLRFYLSFSLSQNQKFTYHFRSLRTKSTVQSNFNFPNYQPFCFYHYLTIFKPVSQNYVISRFNWFNFKKQAEVTWQIVTAKQKISLNQPYYHVSYINRIIDKKSLSQNLQYF